MPSIITIFGGNRSTKIMQRLLLRALIYSTTLLLISAPKLYGQQNSTSIQLLHESASTSFENGEYRAALTAYRQLMDLESGQALHRLDQISWQ